MPVLPTLTINSTELNAQEIYEESIGDPTVASAQLDMLNGRLDSDNYDAIAPPWSIQPGGFLRAVTVPFERWEFVYAKQLSVDEVADNHVVVGALSYRFFLPWNAAMVLVNWGALWRHDASSKIDGVTDLEENWTAKFYLGGAQATSQNLILSASRWASTFALAGAAEEPRWIYATKTVVARHNDSAYTGFCTKGFHTIMCKVTANIKDGDPKIAKLLIPSGAVNIVAVRL